jgi:hypothetical protein
MNECALILHDAILVRRERSAQREKKNFLQRVTQTPFVDVGREVDETESLCHLLLSEGTFCHHGVSIVLMNLLAPES